MDYRKKTKQKKEGQKTHSPHVRENSDRPVITVDYERYAHFLDEADLTEEQKREFLETLWRIVISFVDLGFGVHPLQQTREPCGQLKEKSPNPALAAPDAVYLDHQFLSENFEEIAALETEKAGEGIE